MNKLFMKFRQTGKVEDYLKYREEVSRLESFEDKNGDNKDKRNRNQKH